MHVKFFWMCFLLTYFMIAHDDRLRGLDLSMYQVLKAFKPPKAQKAVAGPPHFLAPAFLNAMIHSTLVCR